MRQEKEIPNGIILHLMEQEELCPEPKQKNELSLDQYKEEMAGVYTTSVNENTLDEAPRLLLPVKKVKLRCRQNLQKPLRLMNLQRNQSMPDYRRRKKKLHKSREKIVRRRELS